MSEILSKLRDSLQKYQRKEDATTLNCLSIYYSYKPQSLHHVPFNQPTLLLVVNGRKEVKLNSTDLCINEGELLLLPPNTTIWIGNYPSQQERYLGLAFRFDEEALKHFRLIYGSSLESWDISAKWHKKSPSSILSLLDQWLNWDILYATDIQLSHHRQVELLLLLAQEGLAGNILLGEHPSWKQRVSQLLMMEPARSWQLKDVCLQLGTSDSSLRRKLQAEKSSFRDLLEEVRLSLGLSLLLETIQPVGQVADAVGYQSQSRFGERFKQRFGMTPSEIRRTLTD